MSCNYCRCEESDIIARYTRFEKNNVLQCRNCGLVYLEITAAKKKVESFYSSEYRKVPTLPVQPPEEHFHDEVTQNDNRNQLQFISNHLDIRGKSILEIGSASGSLLQKLMEHGCQQVAGIELSEEYAEYTRGRGFKIYTSSIEELNLKNEYDAVVAFHTMEHVYDPMAVMKAVYVALKQNGIFLGEVPNQNDWRIHIFGDEVVKRFHYDPNHLYYYSPLTLTNYLKSGGFESISLETVERYNSLVQLRNILCRRDNDRDIDKTLEKYIFPRGKSDEVRLPNPEDQTENSFNRLFARGVNSELMGNCLRWVAHR